VVKELQIRFDSGREVLNSYWGYLSDGGLIIDDPGFDVGDELALEVYIASTETRYALVGTVVKRADQQAVVRFSPGEPHDMLLTEALSETDNVPARRHRRYRVDRAARLATDGGVEHSGTLLDVSEEGCCVQLLGADVARFPVGHAIVVTWDGLELTGKVVWARHTERGIAFESEDSRRRLGEYVRGLRGGQRRPPRWAGEARPR
jgi:hypothetical protein